MRRVTALMTLATAIVFLLGWGADARPAKERSPQTTYLLRSLVMAGAGVSAQGGNFQHSGVLGQPTPVGDSGEAGSGIGLSAGFLPEWTPTTVGVTRDGDPGALANKLLQNRPNPFRSPTTIQFRVAEAGPVSIVIFNLQGQLVRTLVSGIMPPGTHQTTWDGTSDRGERVPQGIYFYRLRAGTFAAVKKMVVLK